MDDLTRLWLLWIVLIEVPVVIVAAIATAIRKLQNKRAVEREWTGPGLEEHRPPGRR